MSNEILEAAEQLGVSQSETPSAPPSTSSPAPAPVPAPVQKPKIDITTLSPIERSVYLDAGENGVLLFRMADGRITIGEAMQRLGLDEAAMDLLLSKLSGKYLFMETETEAKKEEIKIERTVKEVIPIDVPRRVAPDSITLSSEITIRFGPSGKKILDTIDGKLDVVQLAAETIVTLPYVDDLMWFLSERRLLTFTRLKIEDIKKKYGGAGMAMYNEYGREGIYLYMLLMKMSDPMAAIRASDLDLAKAVDMMEFILKQINAPIQFNKKDALTLLRR